MAPELPCGMARVRVHCVCVVSGDGCGAFRDLERLEIGLMSVLSSKSSDEDKHTLFNDNYIHIIEIYTNK